MKNDPLRCMSCGHGDKEPRRTAIECPCHCHDALRITWKGTKP